MLATGLPLISMSIGNVLALPLTGAPPAGAEHAFHIAFWWLTGASVLGATGALWLTVAERRLTVGGATR